MCMTKETGENSRGVTVTAHPGLWRYIQPGFVTAVTQTLDTVGPPGQRPVPREWVPLGRLQAGLGCPPFTDFTHPERDGTHTVQLRPFQVGSLAAGDSGGPYTVHSGSSNTQSGNTG